MTEQAGRISVQVRGVTGQVARDLINLGGYLSGTAGPHVMRIITASTLKWIVFLTGVGQALNHIFIRS